MDAIGRRNLGIIGGSRALTWRKEVSLCRIGLFSSAASVPGCGFNVKDIGCMDIDVIRATVSHNDVTDFCIGWESPAMRGVQSLMAEIASADIPLLVVGEPGVGKEALATQLHRMSPRRDGLLRRVGCPKLSVGDFDALLSPAAREPQAGTTVFLDEVSELDYPCQARLLELLAATDGTSDGRGDRKAWVATTACHEIESEVRAGRFREDLYYRLGAVSLRLPPLRQRRADISVLTSFFLVKYAAVFGRPKPSLSARDMRLLQSYSWPGNIRELENTVKRIVALGDERSPLADIELSLGKSQIQGYSLKQAARAASRQAERELILKVLGRTKWNRKRAAEELQISYKALLYKLKQIGLNDSVD
jgi:two-component system, NtrC family, response regulator AtoC